jgi:hypothetical protein
MPGPGAYDPAGNLDQKGSYFVSKFRSSFARSFSHASRKTYESTGTSKSSGNSKHHGRNQLLFLKYYFFMT